MIFGEQWEHIPGFQNRYFISNHGRVFVTKRYKANDRFHETRKWQYQKKLLATQYDDYGLSWVCLTKEDGKRTTKSIPRLVAAVFMGAKETDKITFRDGDPYNCRVDNLHLSSMHPKATLSEWQYQFCVEQHFEHGIPWKVLGARFLILPDNLRKAVDAWRKRRGYDRSGSKQAEEENSDD